MLGLDTAGHLYVGDTMVWGDCTSFAVRAEGAGGPFLLLITRENVLHTLPLSRLGAQGQPSVTNDDIPLAERCCPGFAMRAVCPFLHYL